MANSAEEKLPSPHELGRGQNGADGSSLCSEKRVVRLLFAHRGQRPVPGAN